MDWHSCNRNILTSATACVSWSFSVSPGIFYRFSASTSPPINFVSPLNSSSSLGIARTAFESMAKILISRNISIELRSRIAKCYIWSTLLYGAETWTLTKVTSDKLEAFEMWLYRRMLRISWKEHKTNADVLHKMKTKRSLLNTIKKRKCQYFGHIIRGDGIQRLLMEGRINGRRGRGRPRTMWTDNIKEWTKMSYNDCIRVAQDRERWRSMTADLLTTDGTFLLIFISILE